MMSLTWWLYGACFVAFIAICWWRWRAVSQPWLTEERCEELSWLVVEDLFENASETGAPIRFCPSYWLNFGLSDSEWIYLCRWMKQRGLIYVPYGLGLVEILMNYPPVTLALTQKSWELTMNKKVQPNISIGSIGDVNGPINVGGEQIVIFGQRLSGDNLRALVTALRQDAKNSSEPRASSLQEAADTLQDAAEGREQATSPVVTGTLKWVRQCVTEAVSNAGGEALLAATMAVAKTLGWV
ncbi:hypothetical protein [Actinomyces sp. oral taxon 181]|uniref:hypothetical protein n=1 Tax=Actinomyces sp. oral taxon 181 TaxID=712121 RepID=UPI0025C1C2BD|nr:hypothetical protein [Actinomyces sp. oral taxon 181]MBS5749977.1 hypothetical protein [Actinomyces sp. oral taxon 181]